MDPRRRARIILILGVLLALGAGTMTFFYAQGAQTAAPAPEEPKIEILVAARELPARTAITAADIKVAKLAVDTAPATGLKDPKEAIGKILITAVTVNEPLLPTKFAAAERAFTVFPAGENVEPGSPNYRVMTITVPDNFAVGGILAVGDKVDIMYVFSFDPATKLQLPPGAAGAAAPAGGAAGAVGTQSRITQDTVAKIILGPMQILSRAASVYTIRVDATLAERIAYIQAAGGQLQMLLRAPTDDRAVTTTGATFATVYTQFKFPLPERIAPQP
ncbi:MAG: Flp pilus assembly protein CpaB [Chloroflexi bacterium]|nr:Flp pilus assembly protein CpaB [Chloroflexota bacterium]